MSRSSTSCRALLGLCLTACATPSPGTPPLSCTLVLLRTGPARDLDADTTRQAFAGHFANMQRLAEQRHLLLAGPFGATRHEEDLRGVFVLDTADRARARALGETDPASRAGIFALEYHDLVTTAPLRELLARELARLAKAEQEGRRLKPGEGCRDYVLLTAEHGDRALGALEGHRAVLVAGRLDRSQAWFVLDATDCDQVPALLGDSMRALGPHVLDAWFASGELAELCRR